MEAINYQLILDELMKGIRPVEELKQYEWMGKKKLICEYRSIGFNSTRQTGKTKYIAGLVDQGKAIMITYEAGVNNVLNQVCPDYSHRVLAYENMKAEDFDKFKHLGIQYVCMDEFYHFKVAEKIYDKLIEVFGDAVIVIRC